MHSPDIRTTLAAATAAATIGFLAGCGAGEQPQADSAPTSATQPAPTSSAQPGSGEQLPGVVPCPTDAQFMPPLPAGAMYFEGNPDDPFYQGVEQMRTSGKYREIFCQLDRLEKVPVGDWVGDWTVDEPGGVAGHVSASTDRARKDGRMPLLVGYNIPDRDLGSFSKGGAADAQKYLDWAKSFSDGLGDSPAVVVWEPDALADTPSLPAEGQKLRLDTLRQALRMFHDNNPATHVYIDAGNQGWQTPEVIAGLLRQLDGGTGVVQGISLNVSNYDQTDAETAYGHAISEAFGKSLKILIDTSRNGAHVEDRAKFCNNPQARVGKIVVSYFAPSAEVTTVDVKQDGSSDGTCNVPGEAEAGTFDPKLLLTQLGIPTKPYA